MDMIAECEADEKDGKGGGNKVQRGPKVSQQTQLLLALLITICSEDCNTCFFNFIRNQDDTKLFVLVKKGNDGNNKQVYPKTLSGNVRDACKLNLTQK